MKGKARLAVWLGHLPKRLDGTEECRFESASWKQGLQRRGGNWERWGQTQGSARAYRALLAASPGKPAGCWVSGAKVGDILFLLSSLAWPGVVPKLGYGLITSKF